MFCQSRSTSIFLIGILDTLTPKSVSNSAKKARNDEKAASIGKKEEEEEGEIQHLYMQND